MSRVVENRAAVFTHQPQVVEVYRMGAWWSGELLGWRHDDSGACQVRVRVVVSGIEQTSWTELATLRLPEPAPQASARPGRRSEPETSAAPVLRALPTGAETTASVPLARDHVAGATEAPGRQSEPETSAAPVPRALPTGAETTASLPLARDHVAGATEAPGRRGGRRRAPEDAGVRVAQAASVPVPAPGRHRAHSADPVAGRHRAADTGHLPTVSDQPAGGAPEDFPPTEARPVPSARPAAESVPTWATPGEELLTRPMRLTDGVPHSRRPRLVAH